MLREKLAHIRRALLELRLAGDLDLENGGEVRRISDDLHTVMDRAEEELRRLAQ